MDDDDFLPLSALQHLVYCPRQCALIHVQQQWSDNRFTAEGNVLHRRVDELGEESRGAVRIARGVPLVNRRLGLSGRADVVEFHQTEGPRPVEYKRGKPKAHDADAVQLCAQALCLEEMHACVIADGDLFYGQPRRRQTVVFDDVLRTRTEQLAADLHGLIAAGSLPPPVNDARCRACSLAETCQPALAGRKSAAAWLRKALAADEA
ncbi:MAG: CRISPR-associated protein Cas4 [Rhodospirillaceae bacterium]